MTDMCIYCCYCDFDWQTFLTAIGTIVTIIGAILGCIQWGAQNFATLDDIYTEDKFHDARTKLFKLWKKKITGNDFESFLNSLIMSGELEKSDRLTKDDISTVARRMNQVCFPRPFVSEDRIIKTWGTPIGKAWGLLQKYIQHESGKQKSKLSVKWKEFEKIGKKCFEKIIQDLSEDDKKNIETMASIILEHFKNKEKEN